LNKDDNAGDWLMAEGQLTRKIVDRHTLIVGVDYRENLRQHELNYDVDPPQVWTETTSSSWNVGIYAQGEVVLLTNLTLSAGARCDYYDSFGATVNPRAGLIYNPWHPTTFKVLYGEAFRAPNRYELYYDSNLNPETIRTIEVVYEQSLFKYYRLSLSGYHHEIGDLIASTETSYVNLDQAQSRGVEIELDGRFPSGLMARLGYALQRTEDTQTGEELSNSPRHLVRLNFIVPLYKDKVFSGAELQYMSGVKTLAGNETDDFTVVNLTLFSQKLVKGLELSASLYNLFDTRYSYAAGSGFAQDVIEQDGRTIRIKLTYRF
jgi:outer membrane receptor for ferrienterochelin and colicins